MRRGIGVIAGLLALMATVVLLPAHAAAQESTNGPDLTGAVLRLADLPDGFGETADLFTIGGLIADLLGRMKDAQVQQHRVFAHDTGEEVVESLLIGSLEPADEARLDAWLANPVGVVETVAEAVPPFGTAGTWEVLDTAGLGDSSFACWMIATEERMRVQTDGTTRLQVALARRGSFLLVVAVTRDGEAAPLADAVALARVLDERLAGALGVSGGGFRPPGLLQPELTTHIPTPGDLSTDPAVVGTNLLLAALAMLAFVAADLVLDATLAQSEARLRRALLPSRWLGRMQQRLDTVLATGLRRDRWPHWLRPVAVVAIYGLVFSFLEPGWNPFSVTGLDLFITMAVSCGVIGQLSGMLKWAVARRYGLPAEVGLRPANLLTAAASLGFSRAFSLYPGLMMGRPVAYRIDDAGLDPPRQVRLAGVGAAALAGLAAAAWVLTIPTSLLQRADLPAWLDTIVGGAQALLLVVFAVGLQNLFREMLALPRAAGRYLSRGHRVFWVAALLVVTFTFWHTLINPDGNLAAALESNNVRFFLGVVGVFVAFTAGVWACARFRVPAPVAPADAGAATRGPRATAAEAPAASPAADAPGPVEEPDAGTPLAGWQPDPAGRHQYRYWDGRDWTDWVADDGLTGRDPHVPT